MSDGHGGVRIPRKAIPEGSRCCPACDAPFDSGVLMTQTVATPASRAAINEKGGLHRDLKPANIMHECAVLYR